MFLSDTKSLAVVREKQAERQGTTIEVRMKPFDGDSNDYVKRIIQYIKDTFIRPSIPINIEDLEHNVIVIKKGPYLQLKNEIYTDLEKTTAQVVSLDLNRFSQILDGRCFFIFFRKKNGELSYYDENNLYSWGRYPFKEERLFDARRVNLVTVNGIRMTAKKTGSLYNFRKHNVIMVVDVDISGSDRITYDVSRDKIIGQGLHFFRRELMNAIRDGLKSMGYYDQLDMETKEHFSKAALSKLPNPPLDKGLLESIYAEIPKSNEWIYGLHKTIADKLGVSANLVEKYIRALISMGRIPKPKKS